MVIILFFRRTLLTFNMIIFWSAKRLFRFRKDVKANVNMSVMLRVPKIGKQISESTFIFFYGDYSL